MEGNWADDLAVIWFVRGRPRGVSSNVCCERLVITGMSRLLGGILKVRVTAVFQGADYRAGLLGLLSGAEV